jgi:hypothetical protein
VLNASPWVHANNLGLGRLEFKLFGRRAGAGRVRLGTATVRARTQIMAIAAMYLFNNCIKVCPLSERIKEQPAVDRPMVASKGDALVEHLLADRAGKNEPVAALRGVIKVGIGVSSCHERLPIFGDGLRGPVVHRRDPQQRPAILG